MCVHPSLGGPSSNREARAIKSLSGSKVSKVNPHGVGVGEGGPNIIENIISRRRRAVMIPIPLRRRPAVIFIPRRRVVVDGALPRVDDAPRRAPPGSDRRGRVRR